MITDTLDLTHAPIVAIDELGRLCARRRGQGNTIALCHGAFDLLHPGHVQHLQAAKQLADVLAVTVTEDRFIRKGPDRPLFGERFRARSVAALPTVDYVATAPWPTGVEVIDVVRPSLYVKGPDYRDRRGDPTGAIAREKNAVERCGGRLVCTETLKLSSTELIEQFLAAPEPEFQRYLCTVLRPFHKQIILDWIHALRAVKACADEPAAPSSAALVATLLEGGRVYLEAPSVRGAGS